MMKPHDGNCKLESRYVSLYALKGPLKVTR